MEGVKRPELFEYKTDHVILESDTRLEHEIRSRSGFHSGQRRHAQAMRPKLFEWDYTREKRLLHLLRSTELVERPAKLSRSS